MVLLLLLLLPATASAIQITGIVSERSAGEVTAGAHRFLDAYPEADIVLRTPEQLAGKSDAEVAALWAESDAVLAAAVFGDQAGRLARLLREQPPPGDAPILAINSEREVVRAGRLGGRPALQGIDEEERIELTENPDVGEDPQEHLDAQRARFPDQAEWLTARAFYKGRTSENMEGLFRWLAHEAGYTRVTVGEPDPREMVRYYRHGVSHEDPDDLALEDRPTVALIDMDTGDRPGDRDLLDAACDALESRGLQCFAVLARWGGASRHAVENLADTVAPGELAGAISLQYFVIGGGGHREAVTEALTELNVPVLKGIRLTGRTETQWQLSEEGLPWNSVHYQVAMPELQGISQPMVLAAAREPEVDGRTGVELTLTEPLKDRVDSAAGRLERWHRLQALDNEDKRVALIYYNHPPGRHNVGADKLDVPQSLHHILHGMQDAGYRTGVLPETPEDLHDAIQDRGVNLIDDAAYLEDLVGRVPSLDARAYRSYFETLPETIRDEVANGPVGYLHARLKQAQEAAERELAEDVLEAGVSDLRHLVENHEHPARDRALDLIRQFESRWSEILAGRGGMERAEALRDALLRTGIPGLSGWGEAPGEAMVADGQLLFPALEFENVVIAPQPPRGWEVAERLLHANTTFPPTHQYIAFYHWLRDHFEADAIVYAGRHSTREFLPRRRAGLAADDYPDLLGGDLPVIYPYIVDGVGEGIQAKRRAMGVIVSHLTPPMAATELYDELLELRQLVETYEASTDPDSPSRRRAVETLRERIGELDLTEAIGREIAQEHDHSPDPDHGDGHEEDHEDEHDHDAGTDAADVDLSEVDPELLVHEVGHYLTHLQEDHMPMGLHVFGRDWDEEAISTMVASMAGEEAPEPEWEADLARSPGEELDHLLAGLDGRFVPPGRGNDPIRTPEVLPTGRNFHAISSDLVPTRVAWSLGQEMAADARARDEDTPDGSEAVILWASDTVRDEGVMVAFGLDMLGVRPVWNARGIVEGLEREPLEGDRIRRDALFTTSGLFRDLYEDQLVWLDQAARLALDGASRTIREQEPELEEALEAALAPLSEEQRDPGSESLAENAVAAAWVADAREALERGEAPGEAGRQAAFRVFGTAPGAYGAGINRLAERSGAWEDRDELGAAYIRRMGHAWGQDGGRGSSGTPAHDAFQDRLHNVGRTYFGRASHLYGLLDNDDGFDFQGGLSVAVEKLTGAVPDNRVLNHADPDSIRVESLERALLGELRGRNLNPQWIEPLMDHGYAGARTFARDFIDNLWGWQVTNPDVVRSPVWDDVHDVYLEDRHDLGLDDFLEQDHNVHVKTHVQSVMLVAAQRDFWDADAGTLQDLSESFAGLVVEHGLPGSGHTRPDHPMLDEVAERLDGELREAFEAVRDRALVQRAAAQMDPSTIAEIQERSDEERSGEPAETEAGAPPDEAVPEDAQQQDDAVGEEGDAGEAAPGGAPAWLPWVAAALLMLLLAGGVLHGRHGGRARRS